MAKRKQTVNEVQLKARRTSLEKKSKDELINIILRKDKSERKMNAKIQELTVLLNEEVSLSDKQASEISNIDKYKKDTEEIIKVKQEQIDALISDKNDLSNQVATWSKKYVNIKNMASIRKKVIFTCFGVIAILIVLLFYLG